MKKTLAGTSKFRELSKRELEICERVAARRRYAGLSQAAMAAKIGLSRDQLSSIEVGRVSLRFFDGWKLCKELNLNPLWLFLGDVVPEQPFIPVDIDPYLEQIKDTDSFFTVCKQFLLTPLKSASREAGILEKPKAIVILRPEWIPEQERVAKSLRAKAAELLHRAEEVEAAIAESIDYHKRQGK